MRGFYVPEMALRHIIPADRLNKRYFRRWFYWRGISRALLYERSGLDMEAPEQTHARLLDGAARRSACRDTSIARRFARAADWVRDTLRGRRVEAFEHELWLCFFAGIVRQRFRDTRAGRDAVARVAPGA